MELRSSDIVIRKLFENEYMCWVPKLGEGKIGSNVKGFGRNPIDSLRNFNNKLWTRHFENEDYKAKKEREERKKAIANAGGWWKYHFGNK